MIDALKWGRNLESVVVISYTKWRNPGFVYDLVVASW